jgi:hypothetical protein
VGYANTPFESTHGCRDEKKANRNTSSKGNKLKVQKREGKEDLNLLMKGKKKGS